MSRYKPNHGPKGMGGFMVSAQLRKPVHEVAELVAQDAGANAPRSEGEPSHGGKHMADEFEVKNGGIVTLSGNRRVAENVVNDNPSAAANEFGGRRNKPARMLGRAGAKYGDHRGGGNV